MKTQVLSILTFLTICIGVHAQTFDWETAYHGADTPNGSGYTNNRVIQQFTTPYESVIFTTPNATPINLSNVGQGTTGLSVLNAAYETSVDATFGNPINVQTIKVFGDTSNENWTFKGKDAGGNVTSTTTATVTNTASVITLNFTNVKVLEITRTNGTIGTFAVDDIVFTPYVAPIVTIPDANFKAYLVGNYAINTNYDAEIQVSEAAAFTGLINCTSLSISDLTGIEAFTNITSLYCSNNSLTSLDISSLTSLGNLECQYNALTSLDISNNSLYTLYCNNNQITSLDISTNTAMTEFDCSNNALTYLNAANLSNTFSYYFNAVTNPNLTCIQVDDVAWSNANWSTAIDATASFSTNCSACIVNIPDANFKAYLVGNTSINTNNDTEIQCSEATAFTGNMYCPSLSISDLTGIEAFTNLTRLTCSDNALTSIDVSNNTALEFLDCEDNSLTNLDVSNNTALDYLVCGDNSLTNLDVSNNTALEGLICDNNSLTSLNVSSNTALDALMFHNNQIASIDISSNTLLTSLHCYANLLTSLDVSANIYLYDLYCSFNSLTSLDVSGNPNLRFLDCTSNSLTSLNVANGNNASFPPPSFQPFKATNNPDLTCIQIDAGFTPPSNWLKDATASFSTNCSACVVNIPDANFKAYLVGNSAINTNGDTEIQCSEATAYTGLINCASLSISDLTGIEAFTNITQLNCSGNNLTSLDVSANTALTLIYAQYNNLTNLDVSNNILLEEFSYGANSIPFVDISNNTAITHLYVYDNPLTGLNLSNNTNLSILWAYEASLTTLDLSANVNLFEIYLDDNALTSLNVANGNNTYIGTDFFATGNPNLTCIQVDDVAYSTTNWIYIDATASYSTNCSTLSVDNFILNEVSLYPNPTTTVLNIKMNSNLKRATIYSVLGAKILETTSKNIPVSNLQNGMYLIKIEADNGSISTKKFLKK
ncbi:T9SS type A sorting domain-containing protein [Lacinutrix sp. MEBiC02404]